jgi:hypothetical protein
MLVLPSMRERHDRRCEKKRQAVTFAHPYQAGDTTHGSCRRFAFLSIAGSSRSRFLDIEGDHRAVGEPSA